MKKILMTSAALMLSTSIVFAMSSDEALKRDILSSGASVTIEALDQLTSDQLKSVSLLLGGGDDSDTRRDITNAVRKLVPSMGADMPIPPSMAETEVNKRMILRAASNISLEQLDQLEDEQLAGIAAIIGGGDDADTRMAVSGAVRTALAADMMKASMPNTMAEDEINKRLILRVGANVSLDMLDRLSSQELERIVRFIGSGDDSDTRRNVAAAVRRALNN